MTRLVIVESPNKAKKIESYLGPGWIVAASVGHIRDLPRNEMGVDLETLRPTYKVTDERAQRAVSNLKSKARQASEVWLATDPDREGEAIAWHCAKVLKLNDPPRIAFQEITKTAVQKAVSAPGKIDMDLVRAQETRRILDRLVGYLVSPAMSNKIRRRGLSAGRVQTVTLRIIVEREREIRNFKPEDHYGVRAFFESDAGAWSADWNVKPLLKDGETIFKDRGYAERVAQEVQSFEVMDVERKESSRKPPAPFITSSLQQAANASLKAGSKKAMAAAQKLFEEGLITYHRTDSTALSDDAIGACRDWLTSNNMGHLIADPPHKWQTKAAAQEAHEAIRPTDLSQTTCSTGDKLADAMYKLIWMRTVASQMASAVYDVTIITMHSRETIDHRREEFVARGRVMKFQGWTALMSRDPSEESEEKDDNETPDEQTLPDTAAGDRHAATEVKLLEKVTKPPPRFTEGTLTKKLEKLGIGRPATYASLFAVLYKRGYVEEKKRKLFATSLGEGVVDLLVGRFQFTETRFTADIESRLDLIAKGNDTYMGVTRSLLDALNVELEAFSGADIPIPEGFASAPAAISIVVPEKKIPCPECDEPIHQVVGGKYGDFWGCSSRDCKTRFKDAEGQPDIDGYRALKRSREMAIECPKCQKGKILRRTGSNGPFWGCDNYPKCRTTMEDSAGKPNVEKWVEQQKVWAQMPDCPVCERGKLRQRKGPKGGFWGCSDFPKCKVTFEDQGGAPNVTEERLEELKNSKGKRKKKRA